jgi:hypothetical protein
MVYENIPLGWVAIVVGAIYISVHLPGALFPKAFIPFVKQFPRNYPLGIILTLAAGIWFTAITATTDLGELSPYREKLVFIWIVATILTVIFVPSFLAVRGLSMLMLLGTCVILDAAFLLDTPARLIMTCLAYVWAILGIIWVCSPYLFRDAVNICLKDEYRCRLLAWPGAIFGLALIALGIFVY